MAKKPRAKKPVFGQPAPVTDARAKRILEVIKAQMAGLPIPKRRDQ